MHVLLQSLYCILYKYINYNAKGIGFLINHKMKISFQQHERNLGLAFDETRLEHVHYT